MQPCARIVRLDKRIVAEMAWLKAVKEGKTFTAEQLARWCCMSDNRHFRAYLNSLAKLGLLAIRRMLCEDGYYRKFFYADFQAMKRFYTPPLPKFDVEEKSA